MQTFDLNLEQQLTSSVIWQVGYVGTKGTHLLGVFDINAGAPNAVGFDQTSRPYYSQFPNFGSIYEEKSNLGSIYHSLQTSLRLQNWHSLAGSLSYTWGHAIDYETGQLPYMPQDPLNEKAERGNSDYDVRQTLTGYVDYAVPYFRGPSRLTKGWELNSGFSFHGGTPFTVTSASNPSNNGDDADRAVQVGNPFAGASHAIVGGSVQWFNLCPLVGPPTNCFTDAAPATYSPTRRGQNYNPGYASVDLAVMKTTPIYNRVNAQFRADMINIFDHTNLAPVGWPTAGDTGGAIGSTIGPFLGNPGIGPGEPFNVQFSLKIIF
jgi:hypothetical protein